MSQKISTREEKNRLKKLVMSIKPANSRKQNRMTKSVIRIANKTYFMAQLALGGSYRLKNMQRFLKKCDEKTLFLIDEFGTGSSYNLLC